MRLLSLSLAFILLCGSAADDLASDRPGQSAVKTAGDVLLLLLPAAGFGIGQLKHDRRGQIQLFESLALTTIVTVGLKHAIDKTRPDGSDNDSFPSGHTSATFSAATFLQKRYGTRYGIPAYAAATFVGFSRLYADKHFFEDVAAGAALGFAASYFLTTSFDKVTVAPMSGRRQFGLQAVVQF